MWIRHTHAPADVRLHHVELWRLGNWLVSFITFCITYSLWNVVCSCTHCATHWSVVLILIVFFHCFPFFLGNGNVGVKTRRISLEVSFDISTIHPIGVGRCFTPRYLAYVHQLDPLQKTGFSWKIWNLCFMVCFIIVRKKAYWVFLSTVNQSRVPVSGESAYCSTQVLSHWVCASHLLAVGQFGQKTAEISVLESKENSGVTQFNQQCVHCSCFPYLLNSQIYAACAQIDQQSAETASG